MTKYFHGVTAALALGFLAPGCFDGSGDPIKTSDNNLENAGGSAGAGGSSGAGGTTAGAAGSTPGAGGSGASSGAGGSGVGGAGGSSGASGQGGAPAPRASSVDLLFVVDNSSSMADKQLVLANAAPDLVKRLVNPRCVQVQADGSTVKLPIEQQPSSAEQACPGGSVREFAAIRDLHVGVITSSLGGHGADYCSGPRVDGGPTAPDQDRSNNFTQNDHGRLITRGPRAMGSNAISFPAVQTYNGTGLLALDLDGKSTSPPATDLNAVVQGVRDLVLGADQIGCGYESPLEAWYRFLIDPTPPATITPVASKPDDPLPPPVIEGIDQELLAQRAAFLRPDSLLMIVMLTDEDDCSLVDGQLPAKICDAPEFDASGKPTGCKTELKGWPAGYVEGNFEQRTTDASGTVTGNPFPINHIAAQQKINNITFSMQSGTPACTEDPYAVGCSTCYTGEGQGCIDLSVASNPPVVPDQPNLRCWNQKQRFGVDFAYAPRRYADALRSPTVIDRNGYVVPNPLFATGRSPENVIFTGLVGVPWQYIARDPQSPASGPRPTTGAGSIDWEQILGDPFNPDPALRHESSDPLLRATPQARTGTLADGSALSTTVWNPYNGHEWKTDNADLQYACIFPLATPRDCSINPNSCDCAVLGGQNPLCEKPGADGLGDGVSTTTQFFAKAFPAPRVLQVIKDVGAQGVLGSLCAAREPDSFSDGYGYRPTMEALLTRARERLQ